MDINLATHTPDGTASKNAELQAWLKENGIDPTGVPQDSHLTIERNEIQYEQLVRNADGKLIRDQFESLERVINRVPLLTSLPDFI